MLFGVFSGPMKAFKTSQISEIMPSMSNWIEKYLEGHEAENILTVGGNIASSKYWTGIYPNSQFTILNIDESELPEKTDKVTPLTCDAQEMTLPDSSFDLVVSNQVLEHIFDIYSCLSEFNRVLKSGGFLLLTTPYHGILKNLTIALMEG